MPYHFLTTQERDLIQSILDRVRGQSINTPVRPGNTQNWQDGSSDPAPETYIAKPQSDIEGIDTDSDPPIVSKGDCDIFKLVQNGTDWELQGMENLSKEVYNITASSLSDSAYIGITRSKSGKWIPLVSSTLDVVGPCQVYTPPDDSEFDISFGDGCLGPNRYGITIENQGTGNTVIIPLTIEGTASVAGTYSTDNFVHACAVGSITVFGVCVFTNKSRGGVLLSFYDQADTGRTTPLVQYDNRIHAWNPEAGGNLELKQVYCDCSTFPYYVCLSVPTR